MESFSLLKYWKSSGGGPPPPTTAAASATTVTAVSDNESDAGGDDDGPFFDLEFALPTTEDDDDGKEGDDQVDVQHIHDAVAVDVGEEENEEVPNMSFSPSDDLFLKGRILEIDGQEEDVINSGNEKSVSGQFPIPVSLAKSATKFRVFLLGLKRSKSESKPQNPPQNIHRNINTSATTNINAKKMFTVKFKVEEVPIFSLLTRASSNSKNNSNSNNANEDEQPQQQQQQQQQRQQQQKLDSSVTNSEGSGDEKKNKKEVVQKYLKMVKPLYVKVSKKNQKEMSEKTEKVGQKQGLNLKVIAKKHLGKSKSAVVHSMEQNTTSSSSSKKRDDSLFQQQDGIQSAILHCKRSFNSSSTDWEEASSAVAEVAKEEGNDVVAA